MVCILISYQDDRRLRRIKAGVANVTKNTHNRSLKIIQLFTYCPIRPFHQTHEFLVYQQIILLLYRSSFKNLDSHYFRIIIMTRIKIQCSNPFAIISYQSACPVLAKHTIYGNRHSFYHRLAAKFVFDMLYRFFGKPCLCLSQSGHDNPHVPVHQMAILQ